MALSTVRRALMKRRHVCVTGQPRKSPCSSGDGPASPAMALGQEPSMHSTRPAAARQPGWYESARPIEVIEWRREPDDFVQKFVIRWNRCRRFCSGKNAHTAEIKTPSWRI